ncbi:MAG: S49 family peptidase [Gammaproteobacteria bacterium]|nr:S49 family peptidase [Gammaproteobacteria bacterium]MCZ6668816.1 S49 family peptidase [Gammaproteobacteria bacterium]
MPESNTEIDYQKIVQKLAFAAINEQRRARRWRIFFTSLFFLYVTVVGFMLIDSGASKSSAEGKHTALVKLSGIIASGEKAGAENVIMGLKSAFEDEDTAGVILEINSPGGSPVQSAYIYDEIKRLRSEHESIPLYVVVADIAASGGYFVAAAADQIYVNKSSLVGSIGVRMDSFGAVDLMKKMGVERRLLLAGKNKGLADPFLPEDPLQKAHLQQMLDEVHNHFIDAVRQGRGDRISQQDDLFSGLIWTGEKAIELGLVDEYGTTQTVARDVIEAETIVNFTPRGGLIEQIVDRLGVSISRQIQAYFGSNIGLN